MARPNRLLVASLLACGLLLAACDGSVTPSAARVNGAEISQQTLNDALNSIADDPGYRCIVQSATNQPILGTGASTFAADFVAGVLTALIDRRALHDAAKQVSGGSNDFANAVAMKELTGIFQPAAGSSCTQDAKSTVAGLAPGYRAELLAFQVDEDALAAKAVGGTITKEGVAAFRAAHPNETRQLCLLGIKVASQARAQELASQVRAGGDFEAIAKANSLDESAANGGDLGCYLASQIGSQAKGVTTLRAGGVTIFQSGDAWFVVKVSSAEPASDVDVAAEMVEAGGSGLGNAIDAASAKASVEVDPAYGTWGRVQNGYGVRPNVGPPNSVLLSPVAITPGLVPSPGAPG